MRTRTKILTTLGLSSAMGMGLISGVKAEIYVLLVGIGDYKRSELIKSLPYDINDVNGLQRAFVHNAGIAPDHVRVMTTEAPKDTANYPSLTNVRRKLRTFAQEMKKEDTLFVYFSGHGISSNGEQYLLCADTEVDFLDTTALSLEKLHEDLNNIPAQQKVLILDACRNDPGGTGKDINPTLDKGLQAKAARIFDDTKDCIYRVIFACLPGQKAQVLTDGHKNSVFSYYMIQGLQGEAVKTGKILTVNDLYEYVSRKVGEWARDHKVDQQPLSSGAEGRPITISYNVRKVLPAILVLSGLDPDVTVEVAGQKYDPVTGKVELEDETGPAKVTLRKPGFKPQVRSIIFKSETPETVTTAPWEDDLHARIALVFPPTPRGYKWGQLDFDAEMFSQEKDAQGNLLHLHGRKLDIRAKSMELWLNGSSAKLNLSIMDKQNTVKNLVGGPYTLAGDHMYEVRLAPDNSLSIVPLEAVFLDTPSEPATQFYAIPAGTDYRVTHSAGDAQVLVNGTVLPKTPAGAKILLETGMPADKDFWILYLQDGRIHRRTKHVTKGDINKKPETGIASILKFPEFDDHPRSTLDLTALPADAKGTVTVEGISYPFDGSRRQVAIELEGNSADAAISIEHAEFDLKPFTIVITSGQPRKLKDEFEVRRLGVVAIQFTSDAPGAPSIVGVNGKPPQDLSAPDTLRAKVGSPLHVTLYQPGYYLADMDIAVKPDLQTVPVHMERLPLTVPDGVWVRKNPMDGAPMVYIPEGRTYKIGAARPEAGHELAATMAQGGYWIYAYPVTTGEYFAYCQKSGHAKPNGVAAKDWNANSRLPLTKITSAEAREYAKWAGGDLPTEEEWEVAARGNGDELFPWKDKWSLLKARGLRYGADRPVGSIADNHSPFGVADMWGHVREWTASDGGSIVRGSSFRSSGAEKQARLTWRTKEEPNTGYNDVGFRVVVKDSAAP